MAHCRVAMEVKAAGVYEEAVHVINTDGHGGEVGNGAFGNADAVEGGDKLVEVRVEGFKLAEGVHVAYVAPGVGKGFFLGLGVSHVEAFEEDIVVSLGVERGIDIDEVDKSFGVLLMKLF